MSEAMVVREALKRWRERLKLSKLRASKAIGVSYPQYRRYEDGTPAPLSVRLACAAVERGLPPLEQGDGEKNRS